MPYDIDLWMIIVACVLALSVVLMHFVLYAHRRLIMFAYMISLVMLLLGYANQLTEFIPFELARACARFGVFSMVSNAFAQYLPEVHYVVWKWITNKVKSTWTQQQ